MLRFAVLAAVALAVVAHGMVGKPGMKHSHEKGSHEKGSHEKGSHEWREHHKPGDSPCELQKEYLAEFSTCISKCNPNDFTLFKCHHHKHNDSDHHKKNMAGGAAAGGAKPEDVKKPDEWKKEKKEREHSEHNHTEHSCKPCTKENFEENTPADKCFMECAASATKSVKDNVFQVEDFIAVLTGMFKKGHENVTAALAQQVRTECYPKAQGLDSAMKQFTSVNFCIHENLMKGCKRCGGGHHGHGHGGKHGKHGKGGKGKGAKADKSGEAEAAVEAKEDEPATE